MENNKLEQLIEAILFWKGEPISIKKLAELCKADIDDVSSSLSKLESTLQSRGIVLMRDGDDVMLGTHPFASKVIEDLTREELSKELSKATLETLSIIIYMSPIKRSEIDYIRGVNSQFSIRHLEVRGLIKKVTSESDSRVFLYSPTFEALSFLGITDIEKIDGYREVKEKLDAFKSQNSNDPNNSSETKADELE